MDPCHAPPAIAAAYAQLGEPQADNFALVQALRSEPTAAVCLLVGGLHVVRGDGRGRAGSDQARRVVWRVRALRALSGRDFRTTLEPPASCRSDEQCQFARREGEWSFFGTWMSRDVAYLAPARAQRKIIASWRGWARSKPALRAAEPGPSDAWYF